MVDAFWNVMDSEDYNDYNVWIWEMCWLWVLLKKRSRVTTHDDMATSGKRLTQRIQTTYLKYKTLHNPIVWVMEQGLATTGRAASDSEARADEENLTRMEHQILQVQQVLLWGHSTKGQILGIWLSKVQFRQDWRNYQHSQRIQRHLMRIHAARDTVTVYFKGAWTGSSTSALLRCSSSISKSQRVVGSLPGQAAIWKVGMCYIT